MKGNSGESVGPNFENWRILSRKITRLNDRILSHASLTKPLIFEKHIDKTKETIFLKVLPSHWLSKFDCETL